MQINWLNRLKNKATLSSLIGIVVLACFQIAQLFGLQLTVSQEQVLGIAEFLLTLLASLGIIVDPNTAGVSDSKQAMSYTEPKKDTPEEPEQ